jgi:uncharacterized OB-fold protein
VTTLGTDHDTTLLQAAAQLMTEDAVDEETLPGVGGLRFQKCDDCGYVRFPVATICPECLSTSFTWASDTGVGTIWSYCIYHRAFDAAFRGAVPYNVALVELDSGPRMISNILQIERADLRVGLRVVGSPKEVAPGRTLVYFRPLGSGEAP